MPGPALITHTAFSGFDLIARGALHDVARVVKRATESDPANGVLVFEDATGQQIDLDLRGSSDEVHARYMPRLVGGSAAPGETRGPGRPRLGVTAREVTLLPRHWEWLNAQPGGASASLATSGWVIALVATKGPGTTPPNRSSGPAMPSARASVASNVSLGTK